MRYLFYKARESRLQHLSRHLSLDAIDGFVLKFTSFLVSRGFLIGGGELEISLSRPIGPSRIGLGWERK
jgi:hypothetical protein